MRFRHRGFPAATLAFTLIFAACNSDSVGAPAQGPEAQHIGSLLVSAPSSGGSSVESLKSAAALVEGEKYSYVSAPPETVPGTSVRIRNRTRDRALGLIMVTEVAIVDGGFDPVAIPASAGDTLEARFHAAGGALVLAGIMVVPELRAPRIVRTSVRGGKKDVPLNTLLEIVFSEPLDPANANLQNVQLSTGGVAVAGTARLTTDYTVAFMPANSLAPGTAYELIVRAGIRNTSGVALQNEFRASFETTTTPSPCVSPEACAAPPPPAAPPQLYGAVAGFVIDESEECIIGARVELIDGPHAGAMFVQTICGFWDYGEDLGFSFGGLPLGVPVTLRATAHGYSTTETTATPTNPYSYTTMIVLARE